MKHQDMTVRLIAKPQVDWDQLRDWIEEQGGLEWYDRIADSNNSAGEIVVEAAGRRCYKSWAEGLNPNVTRVRKDSQDYIQNIVNVGHGSVLEHQMYTFALEGISRVVTHELVRHRVGVAISQESLRYVRLVDIPFRMPDWVQDDEVLLGMATDLIESMEAFQVVAARSAEIDGEGKDFHYKKTVTSDLRRLAPLGLLTGMVWSANIRTLRFVLENRTVEGAEREIRELFHMIGLLMLNEAPMAFDDFERVPVAGSEIPAWVPKRSKV